MTRGYDDYNKKWRLANPKTRQRGVRKYYSQTQDAANSGSLWTVEDLGKITAEDRPHDRVLAEELGRSIQAIQIARHKVVSGEYSMEVERDQISHRGPLSGHRVNAPSVLPTAKVCSQCGLVHPGECY